jgi:hypothetical protein
MNSGQWLKVAGKQALKGRYIPARYEVPGKWRNVNFSPERAASTVNGK